MSPTKTLLPRKTLFSRNRATEGTRLQPEAQARTVPDLRRSSHLQRRQALVEGGRLASVSGGWRSHDHAVALGARKPDVKLLVHRLGVEVLELAEDHDGALEPLEAAD